MAASALRSEERIGLVVAAALHAGLVALLLMPRPAPVVTAPERIDVTISDDVGLTSTSPEPAAQAAPDVAPMLGEPAPAEPEPAPMPPMPAPPRPAPAEPPQPRPEPRPQPKAEPPKPAPKPAPRPAPRPSPRAEPPRPAAKAAPRPAPKASPRPAPKAAPRPAAKAAPVRPASRPSVAEAFRQPTRPGGSLVGDDFLKGVPGARAPGKSSNPPAQEAGPQVQASLLGELSRAIRPHWQGKVPEGADSEKLVTILRWNLNEDGTLAGRPTVVRQEGITDANRPQAARHAEQAIRAVQLAAPFSLPERHYNTWKRVTIRFDKRLSQ